VGAALVPEMLATDPAEYLVQKVRSSLYRCVCKPVQPALSAALVPEALVTGFAVPSEVR
jgi:hypothetical protein